MKTALKVKPALAYARVTTEIAEAKVFARIWRRSGKSVRMYSRNVRADGVLIRTVVIIARERG